MFRLKWALLLLVTIPITGCFPVYTQPSAEEQQQMMQLMSQFNKQPAQQQANKVPPPPTVISEAELLEKINAFPTINKSVTFTKKQNGLEVSGKKLTDPEGTIKFYGFDVQTGDITYLVKTGNDSYVYKYVRANTNMEPVKIGDAVFNGSWQLTTVTGKKIGGDKLIPLGKGFVITREDGSGFSWTPDKAIQSFSVPEGFQVADFQNGDIGGTNYILCERMIEGDSSPEGSVGKLFGSVKALGSVLGILNKEDYLLFNINTGGVVPINISYDLKNEAVHSNCRPSGSKYINKCDNVQFYESLYDKFGMPNGGHYYWAINWYKTSSGPLLIYKDNNARDLYAQNLNNNQKAIILSRMLGINWFTSTQNSDGKVSVNAKMGFSNETVDDVESALSLKLVEKISQK